jgi:hypothetical protein
MLPYTLNGCERELSPGLNSDSYPESVEEEEFPEDCLVLGENKDQSDTSL